MELFVILIPHINMTYNIADWDQTKFLPPTCIPVPELQAVQVLQQAWAIVLKTPPKLTSLAVLYAQWCLEVGHDAKYCHAYNFGNIKSLPNDNRFWTAFRCSEVFGGKEQFFDPPSPICNFRAFKTPLEGAIDYLQFLSGRKNYAKAWAEVINGDPEAYSIELKNAHYYTADTLLYTKGVVSLYNQFIKKYSNVTDFQTHINPPDAQPITLSPEEINHIQGLVALSMDQSIHEYFATARIDDDEDFDPTDTSYYRTVSTWEKITNFFGGKK